MNLSAMILTAHVPGAVAAIQIDGDVEAYLRTAAEGRTLELGQVRLCRIAGIDDAVVTRLSHTCVLLMPHGGPRVVQRIMNDFALRGFTIADPRHADPERLFPEAADRVESLMLAAMARAASPAALDLLLAQPARWRAVREITADDLRRTERLNRLIDPPMIVVTGCPNVGKSTLSNRLLGRPMSIEADLAGTTRDYTSAQIDLGGLVVRWFDTPGLLEHPDPIDRHAILLGMRLLQSADLVLALTDDQCAWPVLSRTPDLRVANKCDRRHTPGADLWISAKTGEGVAALVEQIRERLVSRDDVLHPGPWVFDERLRGCVS